MSADYQAMAGGGADAGEGDPAGGADAGEGDAPASASESDVPRIAPASEATTAALAGPPGAPAIVFVHGTRLTGSMWAVQQAALAGEFRTIAVDLPAHGTRAGEPFTLEGATDAVAQAIHDHADGGPVVVVGLSLGGYVAMNLAARDPTLVRGLVVSGATAEPIGPPSLLYLALAGVLDRVDDDVIQRVNTWFFRTRYPPAIADPIIAGGFWPKGGASAVRSLTGQRFIPRLAAFPGQTLIVNGEFDLFFRLSAPTFAAAAHDARRVRLAGAAHLANLDQPAAFTAAVRRFAWSLGTS